MLIPSHLYVLLNRMVLCNYIIEAESNFLLESIAACDKELLSVPKTLRELVEKYKQTKLIFDNNMKLWIMKKKMITS